MNFLYLTTPDQTGFQVLWNCKAAEWQTETALHLMQNESCACPGWSEPFLRAAQLPLLVFTLSAQGRVLVSSQGSDCTSARGNSTRACWDLLKQPQAVCWTRMVTCTQTNDCCVTLGTRRRKGNSCLFFGRQVGHELLLLSNFDSKLSLPID